MRSRILRARLAAGLAAAAIAMQAEPARCEGFSLTIQENVAGTDRTETDSIGRSIETQNLALFQQYRLSFDRAVFPSLRFTAQAYLDWALNWMQADVRREGDAKNWGAFARLEAGGDPLKGILSYQFDEVLATSTAGSLLLTAPALLRHALVFQGNWRPVELPRVDLRLSHVQNYDQARTSLDTVIDEAYLLVDYVYAFSGQTLGLQYIFRANDSQDRVQGVDALQTVNSLRTTYSGSFLAERITVGATYAIFARTNSVQASGSGGSVAVPQFPITGRSLVEALPATPERDTLVVNPGLIDGEVTVGAGINIGYGPSAAGDLNFRDIGAEFSDPTTSVNEVYVYVDRALPADLARQYQWSAFTSPDNLRWTQVPLAGIPVYAALLNRFEIPIQQVQARFVKVVVKPLPAGATVDQRFADVFVTEIQLYLVTPTSGARPSQVTLGSNFGASVRAILSRDWNVTYEGSASGIQGNDLALRVWTATNSFSLLKQIAQPLTLTARTDLTTAVAVGAPATTTWLLSAGLLAQILPTLGGSLVYSGQATLQGPTQNQNAVIVGVRADLYPGIALQASGGYGLLQETLDRKTGTWSANGSLTLNPNRVLQVTATASFNSATTTSPGLPAQTRDTGRGEVGVTFTPIPALYLYGSIGRYLTGLGPSNFTNAAASLSPFPGGDLLLRVSYTGYTDALPGLVFRSLGPSLTWNIRPGWTLTLGYNYQQDNSPALKTIGGTWFATLLIILQ